MKRMSLTVQVRIVVRVCVGIGTRLQAATCILSGVLLLASIGLSWPGLLVGGGLRTWRVCRVSRVEDGAVGLGAVWS